MANEVLLKTGTAIVLADSADHSPTAANSLGTRTDQIDLTSLAAGVARQSAKVDFGATRARRYSVVLAVEFATAPAAGETLDIYIGYSPSGTAGTGNPAKLTGADAAYSGYSSNLDDSLKQLDYIGSLVATIQATTTVQIALIGTISPSQRYGMIVVDNSTSDALFTDADEMSILISPIVDEVQ